MDFLKALFLCFFQTMLCTLAFPVACGLLIELCYKICFAVMGRRVGHSFWLVTSFFGTPLHECGHALMCFLFGHRIVKVRLFHSKQGTAMVEHTYDRRNLYAVFGNLWISIGPILIGLGVIVGLLFLGFPQSLRAFGDVLGGVLGGDAAVGENVLSFLKGLVSERTRPVWVRLLCLIGMFSMAIHVRLSASDMRGVISGLPMFALLAALVSLVVTLLGQAATAAYTVGLFRVALLIASLFGLILLFALSQLVIALVLRLFFGVFAHR